MLKTEYKRVYGSFSPDVTKHVSAVDIVIMVEDAIIRNEANQDVPIYFTDIQVQPGDTLTGWVPKTDEMLAQLPIVSDENTYIATPNIINGAQPQIRTLDKRTFNVVGRGHQVITIPNYYPEDWDVEILPTGIDLTLFAKDDFDLCRISTATGVLLPDEEKIYKDILADYPDDGGIQSLFNEHPLHYKYTREFWIDGASAGAEIKVHASTKTATLNGADIPIAGQRTIDINGSPFYIGRRRFILAPTGSVRFRVEFYKQATLSSDYGSAAYLKDVGIGYYGTASIVQWTYGRSRM